MALKDQPYIPLYVQDVLTDEKLLECSPHTQGVYFRFICILHKQPVYGKFLLKQKHKQTDKQVENFASALVRPLAFSYEEILLGINELLEEEVIFIDGDYLCQGRMIRDAEISEKRAMAGRRGGKATQSRSKPDDFAQANGEANVQAKNKANTEDVIEDENEDDNGIINNVSAKKTLIQKELEHLKKEEDYIPTEIEINALHSINRKIKQRIKQDKKAQGFTSFHATDSEIFDNFISFLSDIPEWHRANKFDLCHFDVKFETLRKSKKQDKTPSNLSYSRSDLKKAEADSAF